MLSGEPQDREWARLTQEMLREEVADRDKLRSAFLQFEQVLAAKVRQLRKRRGWSQADLAARMSELGWPMDQATVFRLEAGRRPVRVAEAYALAMAFGLPFQALWYLPVPGEPESLAMMRDRLKAVDESLAGDEESLQSLFSIYAWHQTERMRIVAAIEEAAGESGPYPGSS